MDQSPFENPTFTPSVKNPFHRLLKATEAFEDSLLCAQVSEKQVEFRGKFNLHIWAQCLNSSSDFLFIITSRHIRNTRINGPPLSLALSHNKLRIKSDRNFTLDLNIYLVSSLVNFEKG